VLRILVGYGAIVCALPYLALKIIWLTGGQLGVANPGVMHDGSMIALNAITAGMDLVAIAIALAFTHRWGLRIPAWLVLPPIWVATGLLVRFVVGVPLAMIAAALASGAAPRATGGPVQPWVYAVVYTEFAGMGSGLMLAFVLYARTRWNFVFRSKTQDAPSGATHVIQVPLANAAASMAAATGVLHLAWAFGATFGLGAEQVAQRTIASHLLNLIDAATMIAAAAGVLLMVHRPRRQLRRPRQLPFWIPLTLTWVGGGSLFAWGLWQLINVLGDTALMRGRNSTMALSNLLALVQLLAGQVIGLVMLFALAERAERSLVEVE
jgi:hypothetical protein